MTTNPTPRPDNDPHRPNVDPLRPDWLRCDCGATADRDGQCRKCHARAVFQRRATGRRPRLDRPPVRPDTPRPTRRRRKR